MTLNEKRELLKKKQKLLKTKKIDLISLKKEVENINIKEVSISDEKYREIKATIEELNTKIKEANERVEELQEEIKELEKEIEIEEIVIEEITEKSKTKKENILNKKGDKMEYLKTKQASRDYLNLIAENKGKDGAVIRKLWEENLKTKGITNPDALLPDGVIQEIRNALTDDRDIVDTFNNTGLTMFKLAIDTQTGDTARAGGHKTGVKKLEEEITLDPREIRAQYIYKYLTLDKTVIREQRDTDALLKYVAREMVQKIYKEVARAAIIGDGREGGDNRKITSFTAVANDSSQFVTSANATTDIYADLINLGATIKASGAKFAVMSTQTLAQLKLAKDTSGAYIFPVGANIAEAIGVERIFTPDWMDSVTSTIKAVMYVGRSYKLVGDDVIDTYENFLLSMNQNEYLTEVYAGGGLAESLSGAVLKVAGA